MNIYGKFSYLNLCIHLKVVVMIPKSVNLKYIWKYKKY